MFLDASRVVRLSGPALIFFLFVSGPAHAGSGDDIFADQDLVAVEQLVQAVLARNPSLPAMDAAWTAAKSRIEQASALRDPMFAYTFAPDTRNAPGMDFGQKFQLSQNLPWPGKRRLRGEAARYQANAAHEDIERTRLRLIAAAKSVFADWHFVHEAIRINKINLDLWEGFRSVAKLRYANGIASEQDALRAEVEYHKLELKEIELERQRREVQAGLNALLNRAPDEAVPLPASLGEPRPVLAADTLRQRALDSRPQLRALRARNQAARTRIELAQRNFYPDFKLMAGYNSLWNQDEKRTTVGVGINIPLYQGKRRAARDEARARSMRLELELTLKNTEVADQVQRAYDRLQENRQVLALYRERLLPVAERNLEASLADYQSGAGDFLNLVSVEKNLMETQLKTARALANYHRRFADLERLVGGALYASGENK